jgi:hypothetical protein
MELLWIGRIEHPGDGGTANRHVLSLARDTPNIRKRALGRYTFPLPCRRVD